MRTLLKHFVQGCLVLVPTVITGYVVYLVLLRLDQFMDRPFPGFTIIVVVAAITGIGALTSNVLGRRVGRVLERAIGRVPLVRLLYTTLRDMLGAFAGEEKSFDRPAVISMGGEGTPKALGFITRDDLADLGLPGHVSVYLPQSYNFAGNMLVVPKDRVQELSVDAGAFMALVVSGGVVTAKRLGHSERPAPVVV
jgi:uncharacterized membrane protein